MFVLTLFRIIKLITDANEFLSFTWEFIKRTRIGALKKYRSATHTYTHGRCYEPWHETNGDQKLWNGGSMQRSGRVEGPWLVTQGRLERRVFWQVHVWSDVIFFILPTQLLLWSSFFAFWWGAKMLHQRLMLELRMKEREEGGRACACSCVRARTHTEI